MNKESPADPKQQLAALFARLMGLRKYLWVLLLCLIVALYAYLILKINGFANTAPSLAQVQSNLKSSSLPVINQNVVNQLNQLQNNSVSVQALFNQARSNPFQ